MKKIMEILDIPGLIKDMWITYRNLALVAGMNIFVSMFLGMFGMSRLPMPGGLSFELMLFLIVVYVIFFFIFTAVILRGMSKNLSTALTILFWASMMLTLGAAFYAYLGGITFNFNNIFGTYYVIFILVAFFHDLKYEEKPKHLIITILVEFLIFSTIALFEIIGSKLIYILLLVGFLFVATLFVPALIVPLGGTVGYLVNIGPVIFSVVGGFVFPLAILALLAETLAEFFM